MAITMPFRCLLPWVMAADRISFTCLARREYRGVSSMWRVARIGLYTVWQSIGKKFRVKFGVGFDSKSLARAEKNPKMMFKFDWLEIMLISIA